MPDLPNRPTVEFEQLPLFVCEVVQRGEQIMHYMEHGVLFHSAHFKCMWCYAKDASSADALDEE